MKYILWRRIEFLCRGILLKGLAEVAQLPKQRRNIVFWHSQQTTEALLTEWCPEIISTFNNQFSRKLFLYILFFRPNLWEKNQRSFEPLSRYCWSLAGANFSNQNCHSPVSNLSNIYWNMKTCQNFTKCNLRKSFIRFCLSTQSFKWESKSFEW